MEQKKILVRNSDNQIAMSFMTEMERTPFVETNECYDCEGQGEVNTSWSHKFIEYSKCEECNGTGQEYREEVI